MRSSRRTLRLGVWLAASLAAATHGFAAPPLAAQTPPPLPPDTVNQLGLRWDLQAIGAPKGKNPFRFSLCEGRYLAAGEVSRPCHRSNTSTVKFGHNAPFVFSAGHGRFLPKGLGIDGNGILHGDDARLLSKLKEVPLCVRQLDVERCKPIRIAEETATYTDPVSEPNYDGSGPPKKGSGLGKFMLVTVGVVAAGAGVAIAAAEAGAAAGGGSSCVTRSQCCSGPGSGGSCGIPANCPCPSGLFDAGICQAGASCSRLGGFTPGLRICGGC